MQMRNGTREPLTIAHLEQNSRWANKLDFALWLRGFDPDRNIEEQVQRCRSIDGSNERFLSLVNEALTCPEDLERFNELLSKIVNFAEGVCGETSTAYWEVDLNIKFYDRPLQMDPGIARIVLLLNTIGVVTAGSCDGHRDGQKAWIMVDPGLRLGWTTLLIASPRLLREFQFCDHKLELGRVAFHDLLGFAIELDGRIEEYRLEVMEMYSEFQSLVRKRQKLWDSDDDE